MSAYGAAARGGLVAAACVACCAPPIFAALGVTAAVAVTVGLFLSLAVAATVALFGMGWIAARRMRHQHDLSPDAPTPVGPPARRAHP